MSNKALVITTKDGRTLYEYTVDGKTISDAITAEVVTEEWEKMIFARLYNSSIQENITTGPLCSEMGYKINRGKHLFPYPSMAVEKLAPKDNKE